MGYRLPKPQYTKLRRVCKSIIEQKSKNYGFITLDITDINGVLMCNTDIRVPNHFVKEMLGIVASDLGLYDDGTGTNTYTKRGHEMPELPLLRTHAKIKQYT